MLRSIHELDTQSAASMRGFPDHHLVAVAAAIKGSTMSSHGPALHPAARPYLSGPRADPDADVRRWRSLEKKRRLAELSAHDDDLCLLAYQLMDAAGLQRGRLTALALKAEDLISAHQAAEQISLDDASEDRLIPEEAIDRIRAKFGPRVIGPAAVYRRAS